MHESGNKTVILRNYFKQTNRVFYGYIELTILFGDIRDSLNEMHKNKEISKRNGINGIIVEYHANS